MTDHPRRYNISQTPWAFLLVPSRGSEVHRALLPRIVARIVEAHNVDDQFITRLHHSVPLVERMEMRLTAALLALGGCARRNWMPRRSCKAWRRHANARSNWHAPGAERDRRIVDQPCVRRSAVTTKAPRPPL